MEINEAVQYLNALFPECLDYFSMQRGKNLLNDKDIFFIKQGQAVIEVNRNHPLFCRLPENVFAVTSITTTFLEYCIPKFVAFSSYKDFTDNKEYILVNAVERVHQEMYRRLSLLTFGLDVDFITALSGELYESAETTNYQLAIIPNDLSFNGLHGVKFDKHFRQKLKLQNLHAIRKQLNLAMSGALAVTLPSDGDNAYFQTIGILGDKDTEKFPRFKFIGHMEWEFHVPSQKVKSGTSETSSSKIEKTCRMRYRQGYLMLPTNISQEEIFDVVDKTFHNISQSRKIVDVIEQFIKQNKGSVAVFSNEDLIRQEVKRLVEQCNRGIMPDKPIPVMRLPKKLKKSLVTERENNLKRITEIDGAVLFDTNGNCHAFGVILDGECTLKSKGDMARGSRLNSTKAYIEWKKSISSAPWLGVVISEDGMIDLL